jgi:hypothetical protein
VGIQLKVVEEDMLRRRRTQIGAKVAAEDILKKISTGPLMESKKRCDPAGGPRSRRWPKGLN